MNYNDAHAAIHTIEGTIAEWQQTRAAKLAEIAELERTGPGLVLTGKLTSDGYARKLGEIRDQLPMIDSLLVELNRQRDAAKRAAQVARIADLRAQADAMEKEGNALVERRHAVLSQLEEFEGPRYMQAPRSQSLLVQAARLRDSALNLEVRLAHDPYADRYADHIQAGS